MGKTQNKIKNEIEAVHVLMEEADHRHENEIAALQIKIREIQQTCPHPHQTYYPDASGNNDSSYYCDDCGKESHRRM